LPLRLVSWNVLNSRFRIGNIEGQGLRDSLPWLLYARPSGLPGKKGKKISQRDVLVLVTIERLLRPGAQQATVLALQECSKEVLHYLQPALRLHGFAVVPTDEHIDDGVVLYHTSSLSLTGVVVETGVFSGPRGPVLDPPAAKRTNKLMVVATFARADVGLPLVDGGCVVNSGTNTGACSTSTATTTTATTATTTSTNSTTTGIVNYLRVVAGKIPGRPTGPAPAEWARFAVGLESPSPASTLTLYAGDFNFLESEIMQHLAAAGNNSRIMFVRTMGANQATEAPPTPPTAAAAAAARAANSYNTNINPVDVPGDFGGGGMMPKRIDHLMQAGAGYCCSAAGCMLLEAEAVVAGLQAAVSVLDCSGGTTEPTAADVGGAGGAGGASDGAPWEMGVEKAMQVVTSWRVAASINGGAASASCHTTESTAAAYIAAAEQLIATCPFASAEQRAEFELVLADSPALLWGKGKPTPAQLAVLHDLKVREKAFVATAAPAVAQAVQEVKRLRKLAKKLHKSAPASKPTSTTAPTPAHSASHPAGK
jgi:tartrate dehydratase beta subunit/fumarate hydratase class I family protein